LREDESLLGSIAGWHLAGVDWLGGRLEEAERALAKLLADRQAVGERYFTMRGCFDLGQIQQARGDLDAGRCAPTGKAWRSPARRAALCRPPAWSMSV
jgi:hypothetical protein